MDIIDCLLRGHKELRRLMSAVEKCLPAQYLDAEQLRPETMEKFKQAENRLIAKLTAHEKLEQCFLVEAEKAMKPEESSCLAAVMSDHESINDISSILSYLSGLGSEATAYSIRFAVSSFFYRINQHMNYEEKVAFPCLRRMISPARIAAASKRAAAALEQAPQAKGHVAT